VDKKSGEMEASSYLIEWLSWLPCIKHKTAIDYYILQIRFNLEGPIPRTRKPKQEQ